MLRVKFTIRDWMFVVLAVVSGLAMVALFIWGLRHYAQREFEVRAEESRQGEIDLLVRQIELIRARQPLCYSNQDRFPCWRNTVTDIRNLVNHGWSYGLKGRSVHQTLTLTDLGVTEEDLAAFELAHDQAVLGRRYAEIEDLNMCGTWESCRSNCRLSTQGEDARWFWGNRVDALVEDLEADQITEVISLGTYVNGNGRPIVVPSTVPLTTTDLEEMRSAWSGQCINTLRDRLAQYPEAGDVMTPDEIWSAIVFFVSETSHPAIEVSRFTHASLTADRDLAYKRWGSYRVRSLRRNRGSDEVLFPKSDEVVDSIIAFARDAGMKLEDFGTTSKELDALRGRDSKALPPMAKSRVP